MMLKLLYQGPLWEGSTSMQRVRAFKAARRDIKVIDVDTGARVGGDWSVWNRMRWKLRWPADVFKERQALIERAREERPDVVMVDNSRVIDRSTLDALRAIGIGRLVYYTPDDIVSRHNLTMPLKASLPLWDIVFTTKTFNVPELHALGVRRPVLIGKAYDPEQHYPLARTEAGSEFEAFDAIFIGTFEKERCRSINSLARTGVSLVVYGSSWDRRHLHPKVTLRGPVFGSAYRAAWHSGKVALCFLRKINRDRITQRTMEIAAMGRPMVAEKTEEHDSHFTDGREYLGFAHDDELIENVRQLVSNDARRISIGNAVRERCISAGYSTHARAEQMLSAIDQL